MEKKLCSDCRHMETLKSDYCFRNLTGFACHVERTVCPEPDFPGYVFCGPDGRFFEKRKPGYY